MQIDLTQQVAQEGFGPWLEGIVPNDIAASSGAFSASMQQIRNILQIDFQKFAQVVVNLETTKNLNLVNGTSIPVDIPLAEIALELTALGSGPEGTYTMSDFFGCMSGLPYLWSDIELGLKKLGIPALRTIYNNLYLAVKWEQPVITWDGSNFTYTNRGGGYGRAGASAPSVTVGGNPATATIGTDPNNLSTYGKIISIAYSGPAGAVVIADPPDDGTGGWPGMNTIVNNYITQANTQIAVIRTVFPLLSVRLNTVYDAAGKHLTIEQRSRYNAIPPVPDTVRDKWLNLYPTSLYIFVDSIPQIALDTVPHMSAQTLEAISNFNLPGGQAVTAMMRQERNADRLREIGVDLDNNIDSELDPDLLDILVNNGTLLAKPDTGISFPGLPEYTNPASLYTSVADEIITPESNTFVDPVTGDIIESLTISITESPIKNINDPVTGENKVQDPDPTKNPIIVGPKTPTGPVKKKTTGVQPPIAIIKTDPIVPTIPIKNVTPSTYSVQEAIDKVIECNCDCWVN